MRISEIMGSRARTDPTRRVGVDYPPELKHRVMAAAVDLYRELGVDVEVEGLRLFIRCGQGAAGPLMGMLERRTGRPGFNEWWS